MNLLFEARTKKFMCIFAVTNSGLPDAALTKLADADVIHSLGLDGREAFWFFSVKDGPVALFANICELKQEIALPRIRFFILKN